MDAAMTSPEEEALLARLRQGDAEALGALFAAHRDRLVRIAQARLSPRLAGRVDFEDVLQEAFLAASARLGSFASRKEPGSAFVWLRLIVLQTLTDLYRQHHGASMRAVDREVSADTPAGLGNQARLAGSLASPSQVAVRAEEAEQLQQALHALQPSDREVLTLRHFEELSNMETAEVLGIDPKAASIRYVRAIQRLRETMRPPAADTSAG